MLVSKKFFLSVALITTIFGYVVFNNYFSKENAPSVEVATIISPAKNIDSFSLISTDGNSFTNKELKGHWSLLFFGYTSCPDVCPHTLGSMKRVWEIMQAKSSHKYDKPNFFFVTITPKEDNKETLKGFLKSFHADFKGLTGDSLEINKIKSSMGIYSHLSKDGNSIEHSSSLFLVNPQGRVKAVFVQPFDEDTVASDLIKIIKG